jgi:hypothetical protein
MICTSVGVFYRGIIGIARGLVLEKPVDARLRKRLGIDPLMPSLRTIN